MTKPRILVVEDHPHIAGMIVHHLESFDYQVLGVCESGEAALHLVEESPPDLVLMDVNLLGELDGVATAEALRTRFGVRSVLITALGIGEVLPRAQAASPVGFLNKPFTGTTLHATIQMALHLRDVQDQLHRNQQTLSAMLQAAPDGLMVTDLQGRILEANDAACRLTGQSRTELMAGTILDVATRHGGAGPGAALAQKIAARPARFTHSCTGAGDRTLEITFCSEVENAASNRFVCFLRDVTEHRRNEKTLRHLRRAVEQSPVSIVITDVNGRIEYVNPKFEQVTGYTAAEAVGQNPRILKSSEQPREFYENLWTTITQGHEWRGEFHNRRKNGELYWESASISAVRNPAGTITHFIAVKEDITAHKAAETLLVQSNVQLADANAQLTAAVARERALAVAADTACNAKSAFLASMSHELRTPLNVINGVSATMAREFAGTKPAESAELILECGEHLLGIISEILDFSVLQSDHATLDVKAFDLLAVVSAALRQIAVAARQKSLELSFWIAPGTPTNVVSDPRRLQQILLNLLQNAVKFTERGGVHLSVSARALDAGRWRWSFSVADTGIGIDPVHRGKLFQPFAQATGEIARTYGGTGLGLVICRKFAQLMGGDIVLRSRRGRGSCFRCTIEASEPEPRGSTVASLAPAALRGRAVRIIAPDTRARRLLAATTRAWGLHPKIYSGDRWARRVPSATETPELGIVAAGEIVGAPASLAPVLWLERAGAGDSGPRPAGTVLAQPLDLRELSRALAQAVAAPAVATAPATDAAAASDRPKGRLADRVPLRILAADDMPTNRKVLRVMLEYFGYQPTFCVNGAEALAALAQQAYDLLLLDVQMPVMDGLTAAREILRLHPDAARRPKIVALTADALPRDREKCLAAGMDDYLAKPVLPAHIESCILRWFSATAPTPAAAAVRPVGSADAPLVDAAHLESAFPGLTGPALAEILVQMETAALADYEAAMVRLLDACARRDAPATATHLHAMKGCFLTLGWKRIALRCAEAIQAVRDARFTEWTSLPPELRELCRATTAAMAQHLERLAHDPAAATEAAAPAETLR